MTRTGTLAAAAALCAGLTIGCGTSDDAAEQRADANGSVVGEERADERAGVPAPAIQTGCLTAADGRFVLTELESGGDQRPTTETYQLVGNDDELRKYVGRQVRVSGEVEPARVAEVRESAPPATGTAGTSEQPRPEAGVSTQTQTRIEVSRLRVGSVTPTGNECVTKSGAATPQE